MNSVIWLVTPRSLTEIYQDFGEKYSYTLEMEAKLSSEKMTKFWHSKRLLMLEGSILIYGDWI
jgi:hypothetical protein